MLNIFSIKTSRRAHRRKQCIVAVFGLVFVCSLSVLLLFNTHLALYRAHDTFWLSHDDYSLYSRALLNKQHWGSHSPFNRSSCRYAHSDPFAGIKETVEQRRASSVQEPIIHVAIISFHPLLHVSWLINSILGGEGLHADFNISVRLTTEPKPQDKHIFLLGNYQQIHKWLEDHVDLLEVVQVGALYAGSEYCDTPVDARLTHAFVIYGDCDFVDGKRVRLWPLGPGENLAIQLQREAKRNKGQHDFQADQKCNDMELRQYTLNLAVTLRSVKVSRVQAFLASQEVCENFDLKCFISVTARIHEFFGSIDRIFDTQLQAWYNEHFDRYPYVEILAQSKLTLSPSGSHPECFRTMEAAMVGSIPVLEEWTDNISPLYGNTFRCLREDINYFFRAAPVFWVHDWRVGLHHIIHGLNAEDLTQRQHKLADWYKNLTGQLRTSWLMQARLYYRHGEKTRGPVAALSGSP